MQQVSVQPESSEALKSAADSSWPLDASLPGVSRGAGFVPALVAVVGLAAGSQAADLPHTTSFQRSAFGYPDRPITVSAYTDSMAVMLYEFNWNFDYPFIYNLTPFWVPPFWVDFLIEDHRNPDIPMNAGAFALKEIPGSLLPSQEQHLVDLGITLLYIDTSLALTEQTCYLMEQMTWSADYQCPESPVAKRPTDTTPATFGALYCYPNPFNPTTTLNFELEQSADVSVRVFNLIGQQLVHEHIGNLAPGRHEWQLDDRGSKASGVLVVELSAGNEATHSLVTRIK